MAKGSAYKHRHTVFKECVPWTKSPGTFTDPQAPTRKVTVPEHCQFKA